jgi:hypothetical protein
MGSIWFSKKAFLYFGGAAIILIGGVIVLMAPYNYINVAMYENQQRTFDILDRDGYYPQMEVAVSIRLGNVTPVLIDLFFQENSTLDIITVNITLDQTNIVEAQDLQYLETSMIIDIPVGNYTVTVDRVYGAGLVDLGFNQMSDSRLFITVGGSMNIIGLIMGIVGYFLPGTFLPTSSDTIIQWGYEEEGEDRESYQGN